ncbi:exopolysaccharide biosynthesis polyprenyl glycosylphosphotransferase [Leucobacter exalbidus]|uniref:Exopolysaccharide biosynthesis polyprenyl glycosylphosphotransferase n=1 Tax=Leucobacter exalbidus TaxID=662960 RepID=A0A940PSW8_9MICO|nr:sugar transferase [Leucobacter exalbidus]MBP1326217.1 exopolysaccharide biosynthesis polyprenyl glycosylphosphotransferase [Leucobacter exalbidus]
MGKPAAVWEQRYARRLFMSDTAIVIVSVVAAQLLRYGVNPAELELLPTDRSQLQVSYTLITVALIICWLLGLTMSGSRSKKITGIGSIEYKTVITATLAVFGVLAIVAFALRSQIGRGYVLIALPVGLALLLLSRWLWRKQLHHGRDHHRHIYRTLIIGDRAKSALVASEISRTRYAGFGMVGAITEEGSQTELLPGLPVVGDYTQLVEAVDRYRADVIILTSADALTPQRLREVSWQLEHRDVALIVSVALTGIAGPRIHTRPVSGLPLVHVEFPEFTGRKYFTKRLFDLVCSLILLVATSPIMLVTALMIRLDSPGPVIFKQERVGIGGVPFTMFKFRSMYVDAEARRAEVMRDAEHTDGLFKMKNDPRVTRVGAVLRKYSIDELPQFVNVLLGKMSLVGPRPPLPSEVQQYDAWVHRRLLVKPGITGPWQVSGRSDLSWDESIRLDMYYVENWSLVDDFLILMRTVRTVVAPQGAY